MTNTSLQLTFRPTEMLVSTVRQFVYDLLESELASVDDTSRVALTVYELVENVVRYSLGDEGHLSVDLLANEQGDTMVQVKVRNRANAEQQLAVSQLIADIDKAPDPLGHYYSVMAKSAKRTEGSGLGLARICAEAEMKLREVAEGDMLTIIAVSRVELAAA